MKLLLLFFLSALPRQEMLTYEVWLGPIHAGEMKLSLLETQYKGQDAYRFRSVLYTKQSLSWLYRLHDTLYSYVAKDSFKLLYFEKRIHESNYDTVVRVRYDWNSSRILYEDGTSYPLIPGTLDLVSIYYYFRLNPLGVNEERKITIHADRKTETSIVKGAQEVAVRSQASPTGLFSCTKLVPEVTGKGSFGSRGKLLFYMTNDNNRYPALIKTMMTLGSITARLKRVWQKN